MAAMVESEGAMVEKKYNGSRLSAAVAVGSLYFTLRWRIYASVKVKLTLGLKADGFAPNADVGDPYNQ